MSLGYLADPLGRERTLSIACMVFIVGAVIQAASYTITQIVCSELCKISILH
jgi:MFS family permease